MSAVQGRLPGLFHLALNATQETNSKNLSYRIKSMNKLKRDVPGKFTYSAASNLLGVFLFYNKQVCEAIQEFVNVLSLDGHNINALENLIFVYQKLQMNRAAESYERKKANLEISNTETAIHLFEQGFAYRFDCYGEKDELERCQRSIDLYYESMKLLPEKEFQVEIKFWLIQCLQQKFNACVRRGDDNGKWDCYKEGLRLIKQNFDTLGHSFDSEQKEKKFCEHSCTRAFSDGKEGLQNVQDKLEETKMRNFEVDNQAYCSQEVVDSQNIKQAITETDLSERQPESSQGSSSSSSKQENLGGTIGENALSKTQADNSQGSICIKKKLEEIETENAQSERKTDSLQGSSPKQAKVEGTITGKAKSDKDSIYSPLLQQNEDAPACDCDGNLYWRAMTLTYLGIYLSKNPKSYWDEDGKLVPVNDLPDVVKNCGFDNYFTDPESCFKEAVDLMDTIKCKNEHHGDGSECRIRYAISLRNKNKSLDYAVALLDKVISRDNTESDWFAMTTRSQINEKRARQAKDNDDQDLAKQFIKEAIRDAEKCQAIQLSASEYARTGSLYHFKAKYYDSLEEQEMSKLKASENFMYAVQSIREEKRPHIHRMHGSFFKAFGEHRQAIECYKRGIAADTSERETLSFKHLFETFLCMNKNETEDMHCSSEDTNSMMDDLDLTVDDETDEKVNDESDEKVSKTELTKESDPSVVPHQNVLYEMVYWFKFAYERYGKSVESHIGTENRHRQKTMSDMKKIVKKFTSDYKHKMSDIAAYFKVALGQTAICNYITECSEGVDGWDEMINKATKKWTNKHPYCPTKISTDAEPCPLCGNCKSNLSRQISVFPGSHTKPRSLQYEYDFYIIYSTKDEDWVLFYLLTGLETTYGFKGAVAERDFHPGCTIFTEINRLCDQSFKVLLILSDNFSSDALCSYGMTYAMTKQIKYDLQKHENYIIPIIKSRCEIPHHIKALHALDASSDLDWERLALNLESKL